MSKGKVVILVTILGLTVLNVALALLNFTSLGVPYRYEEAAPTDKQTQEFISKLPDELFDLYTGWMPHGSGYGGMSADYPAHQLYEYSGSCTFEPIDPSKIDPMKKLLEVVLALQEKARSAGFALAHDDIPGETFGDEGQYGPRIAWDIYTSTGPVFSGTQRYACVSLDFVAPKNPAIQFRWTIICDRKNRSFVLFRDYLAVSPVYVGRQTPTVGHYLRITARESQESASMPAPATKPAAPKGP